ncbi:MAG: hypothetical protein AAF810_17880 [Cyanobacteria bacterium P01_D01_bin.36]
MKSLSVGQPYGNASALSAQHVRWVCDRFGPQTAVVDTAIVGRSNDLGVITYQGGQFSKATTYEPVVLPKGTRVRILGRIKDTNILVVIPLSPIFVEPPTTPQPNPNWADKYLRPKESQRRASG